MKKRYRIFCDIFLILSLSFVTILSFSDTIIIRKVKTFKRAEIAKVFFIGLSTASTQDINDLYLEFKEKGLLKDLHE